ncbi:hypothetical protein [Streptomyces sp. NPDC003077]|uniref:DUF7224 domain-containing protein n=1 Tax=Streptomyces sp. NPDC003077 TaxID=3154443 RepID=UPI0033A54B54
MAVAMAVTISATQPRTGFPPLGIVPVWMLIFIAHGMAGSLFGRYLPLVVAAPLALILSFVLIAYPAAFEPLWLRHMVAGGTSSCCALDETFDWRAAASAAVLALGVIAAASVAIAASSRLLTRGIVCLALLATGLVGSGRLAYGLPAEPATPRAADQLVCSGNAPRLCVWPEAVDEITMIRQNASEAWRRLRQAGLSVPGVITMSSAPEPGSLFIGVGARPTPDLVRDAVGEALMPMEPPRCAEAGSHPGIDASGPVGSWLLLTAGADEETAATHYGRQDAATAVKVRQASREQQLAWYRHNSKALQDCTTQPAPVPSAAPRRTAGETA